MTGGVGPRRLVVLRHAKSAYPPGVLDHDRPLAPRGVVDARAAGAWIRENVGLPDHVVVSSARRARGTWTLAAGEVGYIGAAGYDVGSSGPLTIDPRVYDASARTLVTVLRELPERVSTAVLVGHMPGVEELVDQLSRSREPEAARLLAVKYPTVGIAVLDVGVPWSELDAQTAHLAAFAVPRG
jgi:phosphohistidine phosphatase